MVWDWIFRVHFSGILESILNVFETFLNDENYLFADFNIAISDSTNWSWPGWNSLYSASHFDHFIISNELYDEFAVSPKVKIPCLSKIINLHFGFFSK